MQPCLVPHDLGLNHPAEEADNPPHRQKGHAPLPLPQHQENDRPGDHHRPRPHNGDKVQNAQGHRQQHPIGLPKQEKAHQKNPRHPQGDQNLRLEIAPKGGGKSAPGLYADAPDTPGNGLPGHPAEIGIILGGKIPGHQEKEKGQHKGGDAPHR